jgi:geranylgeranyl diphosphate synthase type I
LLIFQKKKRKKAASLAAEWLVWAACPECNLGSSYSFGRFFLNFSAKIFYMDAKQYLTQYVQQANEALEDYFQEKKKLALEVTEDEVRKTDIPNQMMGVYQDFCKGGKKLRGSLINLGYLSSGGKNNKEIIKTSIAIEIIHAFLLIHDDIMDKDEIRRGAKTIHLRYQDFYNKNLSKGEANHYGLSMAIDLGDCGAFMGMEIIAGADFPGENKAKALKFLGNVLLRTAFGQGLDVTYELTENISEDDVMRVHLNKTAHYTISGPLSVGALLAGADKKTLEAIKKFGVPVGVAFQLRDDELGLFSSKETLGKPIGSDVREGKITVLRIKALEKANKKDEKFLNYAYGNRKLTDEEVERVRKITEETGALKYSQKLSRKLVEKGKKFVPKITSDPEYQDTLLNLADFIITRSH